MIRLATDVGGTFTDLVAYDERSGGLYTAKGLTTADDQSVGLLDVIAQASDGAGGLHLEDVVFFVHGGTTVINAVTERKGVKTALVTTAGFRDVLEIGRGNRPDLYNLQSRSPEPFVPRHLRFEMRERLGARGEVVTPLHEEDLAPIVNACRRAGVEAIGVIFLHSYANPAHERRCVTLLREALPEVTVAASHEVSRQWREFERSNTVALNAYVQPIIRRYFENLEAALDRQGVTCPYFAMQSNGGMSTFAQAVTSPLTLVESGPSGGVAGAVRVGEALGESDVLHLDVGGTTAKCSLIRGGQPKLDAEYRLEWSRITPGYPIQVPVVDIVEIGAGGGSIAWIDRAGGLKVGPLSAGSTPGPASYRRGGMDPTVTDAKLVIGLLDPASFAGGRMTLDLEAARTAIQPIAAHLSTTVEEAAAAVVRVAEMGMINALKLVTVQRGHDPRDLAFTVSGGAGPMFAANLGRELQVKATVIPFHPGIFSAWGMLAAQPRADLRRTHFEPLGEQSLVRVNTLFEELEREAATHFGIADPGALQVRHAVDMRYRGQEHSVAVAYDRAWSLARFLEAFHEAHETAYSFRLPGTPAEVTGVHLQAALAGEVIRLAPLMADGLSLEAARKGTRDVYLGDEDGWVACPVFDRGRLPVDEPVEGPALIEEPTSTTFLLAGQDVRRSPHGFLVIREAGRGA